MYCIGKIEKGLLVLLGVGPQDTEKQADFLAEKCANLRIFVDENDKMNLSLLDIGGEMLVVSQFTLYADCNMADVHPLSEQQHRQRQTDCMNISSRK